MEPKQSPEEVAEEVLRQHQWYQIDTCMCGVDIATEIMLAQHQVDRLKDAGLMIGFSTSAAPDVSTAEEVTFVQEVKPGEHWELSMKKDEPEDSEGYQPWGEQAQEGVLNFLRAMSGKPMDPDCVQGKHKACGGTAWDTEKDEPTLCSCSCHTKE